MLWLVLSIIRLVLTNVIYKMYGACFCACGVMDINRHSIWLSNFFFRVWTQRIPFLLLFLFYVIRLSRTEASNTRNRIRTLPWVDRHSGTWQKFCFVLARQMNSTHIVALQRLSDTIKHNNLLSFEIHSWIVGSRLNSDLVVDTAAPTFRMVSALWLEN